MCRIGLLALFILVPTAGAADLEPLATLKGHKEAVRSVGFTPDGNVVSTGYKEIHVWDVKDLKDIKDQTFDTFTHEHKWGTPRLSACGKFVAIGGAFLNVSNNFFGCSVRLFKIGDKIEADGELAGSKDVDIDRDTISEVAFSPDSKILAAVHYGGPSTKMQYVLSLHDLETRRSLNDSVYTSDVPLKLAYSPDGKLLAAGDAKGTILLWKANSAKSLYGLADSHKGAINDLAFSPDSKTLATVGDDKAVRLWDLEKKELKKELGSHDEAVLCVAFSKDGKYLATGGRDHNVKIWDAATGKELAMIEAHLNDVTCVAFSPNGKTLATGSADKYVRLWDVAKALKK